VRLAVQISHAEELNANWVDTEQLEFAILSDEASLDAARSGQVSEMELAQMMVMNHMPLIEMLVGDRTDDEVLLGLIGEYMMFCGMQEEFRQQFVAS